MPDKPGSDDRRTEWLTYLVYILLTFLTAVTGWGQIRVTRLEAKMASLPDHYVRLERYKADTCRVESLLTRISDKIDGVQIRCMPKGEHPNAKTH